jgi:transposase-like protein
MQDSGHIPVWPGQSVARTNRRGRRVFCEPFKTWIVEQAMLPGMSTAGLAMRNQVNANQLRRWVLLHRRCTGSAAAPELLPVTITRERAAPESATRVALERKLIEVEVAGAIVRVPEGADPGSVRSVLQAVRASLP